MFPACPNHSRMLHQLSCNHAPLLTCRPLPFRSPPPGDHACSRAAPCPGSWQGWEQTCSRPGLRPRRQHPRAGQQDPQAPQPHTPRVRRRAVAQRLRPQAADAARHAPRCLACAAPQGVPRLRRTRRSRSRSSPCSGAAPTAACAQDAIQALFSTHVQQCLTPLPHLMPTPAEPHASTSMALRHLAQTSFLQCYAHGRVAAA